MPGVVAAGWTSGVVEMDRTIRFAAAEWRDGDKLNKDKIASAIVRRADQNAFGQSRQSTTWNANTGKLKLTLQAAEPGLSRRSRLTETVSRSPRWCRRTSRARPTG